MTNRECERIHKICKCVKWNLSRLPLWACPRGCVWINHWSVSRLHAACYRWQTQHPFGIQTDFLSNPPLTMRKSVSTRNNTFTLSDSRTAQCHCIYELLNDTVTALIVEKNAIIFPWMQMWMFPQTRWRRETSTCIHLNTGNGGHAHEITKIIWDLGLNNILCSKWVNKLCLLNTE